MSVTLALLLATPLFASCGPVLTFQDMLDSANIVVIAKVDSMWYSLDTVIGPPGTRLEGQLLPSPLTNVSAEILTIYTKHDSLLLPQESIYIVYSGGPTPSGLIKLVSGSVTFEKEEVFLAAVEKYPLPGFKEDYAYRFARVDWKYTITNDSLYVGYDKAIPLGQALQVLSEAFPEVRR